ncbi:MAG: TraX family protein [Alphaproteobacteria bacterium]
MFVLYRQNHTPLSPALTSYDILKTLAIVLMIIDHVGAYFYPDESWFRVLGRLCVPIWFFLIGYARTRDIAIFALVGAGLIALGNMFAGETLFPLSILVGLMIGRYCIDALMGAMLRGGEALLGLFFMLLLLWILTGFLFEYGTMGLLFTVSGASCRYWQLYQDKLRPDFRRDTLLFMLASFVVYLITQAAPMEQLSGIQFFVLVFGLAAVGAILWRFQSAELPHISAATPKILRLAIQFTGRRTLEIYVLHLLAFKALAVYLYPDRFPMFEWKWVNESMMTFLKAMI